MRVTCARDQLYRQSELSVNIGPQRVSATLQYYAVRMAVLVDDPLWPAHGTLWAHLVSDTSLEELHDFASRAGFPQRSFDRDHYDVPMHRIDDLVALGAERVSSRELVRRLLASGLRIRPRDRKR